MGGRERQRGRERRWGGEREEGGKEGTIALYLV